VINCVYMEIQLANKFRKEYDPFHGGYHEFGFYRILERYLDGKFVNYACEHAGLVFAHADLFEEAVEKCQRHGRPFNR